MVGSLRDHNAKARINVRIRRISVGNFGDVKAVGEGVRELRVDYGPGYRVYFVQQGEVVVILLCGGDKRMQARDIEAAKRLAQTVYEDDMATKTKTTRWDPAEHLTDKKAIAAYINAALEDGDPTVIAAALGDVARAEGMTKIARDAGLTRASLYKALGGDAKAEFGTILRVLGAIGVKLHAKAA
jgi:putative addiction module killer protein/probable addiction module antidote protein